MKLLLKLVNFADELDPIAQALARTDIEAFVEGGRVVLKWDAIVERDIASCDAQRRKETWNRVHELIAIVNGAGRLEGTILNAVNLGQLCYLDPHGEEQFFPIYADFDGMLPACRSGLPDPSQFVSLGLHNEAVAKALRLFSGHLDWVNLYRIFEVIVEDVPKVDLIRLGWATHDDCNAFTGSANNASVTGDSARHGKIGEGVPRSTMSLANAQRFVSGLLRTWLEMKSVGD